MSSSDLADALGMAQGRPVFVATADAACLPHLACAGRLRAAPEGRVLVTEWFCPGTVGNVAENPRVSLVVWDEEADAGYQLLGSVERVDEMGILDGYAPQAEPAGPLPQVQRRLVVRVERVLKFRRAPHADVEE